jgi:hypothetical protein
VWTLLEQQVDAEGLPPRCVAALYQVFVSQRVRRGTYQSDEALSQGQAARDLRELVKHQWLIPRPAGRDGPQVLVSAGS